MVIHPIIIIGAGPAGIATAVELINEGYKAQDIIILERSGEVAHMIASKYPDEKPVLANYKERMAKCIGDMCISDMSKQDFLDYLKDTIKEKNLHIRYHQEVQRLIKLNNGQWQVDCQQDSWICNVVFVAIGNMSAPRTLDAEVSQEASKLIFSDLQNISLNQKNVLVVGGGDSASEYAQILCERGHCVSLSYRKDKFTRLIPQNLEKTLELIENKKINFLPKSLIKSVSLKDNEVIVEYKETYPKQSFHAIVTALGNERPKAYLKKIGIDISLEGGGDFKEADQGGIFLVGDIASGPKGGSINVAFNSATKAVGDACHYYLDCKN